MGPHSQTASVFTLALASLAASASAAMALCSCTGSLTSFLKKKIYNRYPFNRSFLYVLYSFNQSRQNTVHVQGSHKKRPKVQQNKSPNKSAFLIASLIKSFNKYILSKCLCPSKLYMCNAFFSDSLDEVKKEGEK
jgi:hypothetical protein